MQTPGIISVPEVSIVRENGARDSWQRKRGDWNDGPSELFILTFVLRRWRFRSKMVDFLSPRPLRSSECFRTEGRRKIQSEGESASQQPRHFHRLDGVDGGEGARRGQRAAFRGRGPGGSEPGSPREPRLRGRFAVSFQVQTYSWLNPKM